jgi:beta-N-acetylhexosaminidase
VMTAHVRVGDEPATLDPAIARDLLRGLGFEGALVSDALDMKGVSGRRDVADAAVLALSAGVDAVILGHDTGEAELDRIVAALEERVDPERLEEAASRVDELSRRARPRASDVDREAARGAAARAVHVEGDVAFSGAPRVVELRAAANIAAGEAAHRLGDAAVVHEGEPVPDADVFVVRDVHRHPWMEAADRPGAVVVETGIPVWRPSRARAHVTTYGGGRAALAAVEEILG